MNALEKAIKIIGNQSSLARLIGVSPQAVQQWVEKGKPPIERSIDIEEATKGRVKRCELRPDIFLNENQMNIKANAS